MSNACPRCGAARSGTGRYCSTCAYDFWGAAAGQTQQPQQPATVAPAIQQKGGGLSPTAWVLIAVVVVSALGGVYLYVQAQANQVLQNVANDLESQAGSRRTPAPQPAANVPPVGDVWFGSTFDPDTMSVRSRTSSVRTNQSFAVVAHLPRVMDAGDLVLRLSWNGDLITSSGVNASGSGDIWGFSGGPLFSEGEWTYEFTDITGNVLASGTVTAE